MRRKVRSNGEEADRASAFRHVREESWDVIKGEWRSKGPSATSEEAGVTTTHIPKPCGRVPSDAHGKQVWDGVNGLWRSQGPHAMPTLAAMPEEDSGGTETASGAAPDDDDGQDFDVEPNAKKAKVYRSYVQSWIRLMPSLLLVSILTVGSVCTVRGSTCTGCERCTAMFYSDCQLGGERNAFVGPG